MIMTVKIGIAGLGFLGQSHFANCQAIGQESGLAEVTAVADCEPARLAGYTPVSGNLDLGSPRLDLAGSERFEDAADMIERADIDAVFICLPTYLHASMAVRAAQRGKHIFCEKPMALTLAEADAMIAAAQRGGVRLMIGHCLRFWPEFQHLKEAVSNQRLGALRSLSLTRLGSAPVWSWHNWMNDASKSGGGILDLHIHDVDLMHWVLGVPGALTSCGWHTGASTGGIDWVETSYEYGPGVAAHAHGGWLNLPGYRGFEFGYEALFEQGWIRCNGAWKPTLVEYSAGAPEAIYPTLSGDAYVNEDRFFIECLAEGRDPATVISAEEARASLRIALAEEEAIRSGQGTVKLQ
jgi:predicted dehydrogenase